MTDKSRKWTRRHTDVAPSEAILISTQPTRLGKFTAVNDFVSFRIENEEAVSAHYLVICSTSGTLIRAVPALQASMDGGQTWIGLSVDPTSGLTSEVSDDVTPAAGVARYDIGALRHALFRFGFVSAGVIRDVETFASVG
ncbi:hypothetical protein [Terriglobus sp. TAA 43]|uniref:hypothetical protein n=1 Tax=Terriglobus sp. TAA 43 TaxID=278961 RepID=UPI0006455B39|nr:hypothetical protein [Terriglobus sp. TAA 43]